MKFRAFSSSSNRCFIQCWLGTKSEKSSQLAMITSDRVPELNKPENVLILSLEPSVFLRVFLTTFGEVLDFIRNLQIPPICPVMLLKPLRKQATHRVRETSSVSVLRAVEVWRLRCGLHHGGRNRLA